MPAGSEAATEPVVLVRHAEPAQDSAQPPAQWPLSDAGHQAAARLGRELARLGLTAVLASDETKAVQTAQHLATATNAPLVIDQRLREVERPWIDMGFAEAVARYLTGETVEGWETRDLVVRRIDDAIRHLASKGPTAIVTHGTAMTVYLDRVATIRPVSFWSNLTMPDAWLFDGHAPTRIAPHTAR